ncbi:MAG: hypothetical protein ABGZ53_10655 [Fuerstiella sp.]
MAESLETRILSAAIVSSIDLSKEAAVVLPDVNGHELLVVPGDHSTMLYGIDETQTEANDLAEVTAELCKFGSLLADGECRQ